MLNRNNRYEIIRELIKNSSPETINELVINSGFKGYSEDDDIEYRRNELLSYLDEMNEEWKNNHVDLIDRQYVTVIKDNKEEDEGYNNKLTR